jgi:DNA-binding transcriptional regulator YiaG
MQSREFRELQSQAGLKNRDLERLFQVSDQTVINWRRGHTRIPGAAAALLLHLASSTRRDQQQ